MQATADEMEGVALTALRRIDESKAPASRALATWIARRDDAGILRLADNLSSAYVWGSGGLVAGREIIGRALDALAPAASRERAILRARLGAWLVHENRCDEALALRDAALASVHVMNDPVTGVALHFTLANISTDLDRVHEALAFSTTACAQLEGAHRWQTADALYNHVRLLGSAGRPDQEPHREAPDACGIDWAYRRPVDWPPVGGRRAAQRGPRRAQRQARGSP